MNFKGALKGITLIGELIAFLFLIGTGFGVAGQIIYAKGISQIAGGGSRYDLNIYTDPLPFKHELALLSLLECTKDGIPIKEVLPVAVAQKRVSDIKIYQNNKEKTIHLDAVVSEILKSSKWLSKKGVYILRLKVGDNEYPIASQGNIKKEKILRLQKVSIKILSPFEDGYLELMIG